MLGIPLRNDMIMKDLIVNTTKFELHQQSNIGIDDATLVNL